MRTTINLDPDVAERAARLDEEETLRKVEVRK